MAVAFIMVTIGDYSAYEEVIIEQIIQATTKTERQEVTVRLTVVCWQFLHVL